MSNPKDKVMIETVNLVKEFEIPGGGLLSKKKPVVHATSNVNIQIMEGETLELVGESGCGKSTLGRLLISSYAKSRYTIGIY